MLLEDLEGWGPSAKLSVDFAKKARETPLDKEFYKRIQEIGLGIIKDYFEPVLAEDVKIPYVFMEESFLLNYASVPGNACDLGLEHFCQNQFFNNELDGIFSVRYTPHNVDSQVQASCLISLWLNWANSTKILVEC